MSEVTRHFTATTFVVDQGKVLLHRHAKQGLWLPPGGHIERDELPHLAALREVEEETGLEVRLHSEAEAAAMEELMDCGVVPQPAMVLVEDINPFHQHIDFIYYARPLAALPGPVHPQFAWYAPNELTMAGVPRNVIEGARLAVEYYRSRP